MVNTLLALSGTFLKIGAFTFGGGLAMIPLIQREAAERHGWVTEEDIIEMVAIAESTPGPVAINVATFVGYKTAGVPGAVCATLGVILPSFCIICLISGVLRLAGEIRAVQYAFRGIRACILALICRALYSMYKRCPKNPFSYCIAALVFLCIAFFQVNAAVVLLGAAVLGVLSSLAAKRRLRK